ncbi:hypothetical protein [Tenacibaculum jejuense]|uniref:Uncharacterized protein n=1 Tax=Tenacibaculum jejuense TaxID=584609 RepID=A0A238UD65_9FLAO|nr:hypothetical protein [Tenacibaculum jejuense]SNR16424.1 Probable transmembrane protein of unknown function [Tenacibaculum jejuense]
MKELKKVVFSIILSLGMITDDFLIFEYICDYPELGPRFYGFPFVQETNTTWVNSMSGEIYLFGFLGNFIFWIVLFRILIQLFIKLKQTVIIKLIQVLVSVLSLFYTYAYFLAIDWRLSLTHDNFKLHYYQSEPSCKKIFKFSRWE